MEGEGGWVERLRVNMRGRDKRGRPSAETNYVAASLKLEQGGELLVEPAGVSWFITRLPGVNITTLIV